MKRILAVLTGCIIGVMVIFMAESLSHVIYPIPANTDLTDPAQLKEIMANAPPMSLILVLVGAFSGSFVAGFIATVIMRTKDKIPALIIAIILTALATINLVFIPHPMWFIISALMIYFAGSLSGYAVYSKMKTDVKKN